MMEAQEAWEAPFVDAFDEDTQSFPFGTNSLYANPDCTVHNQANIDLDIPFLL